MTIDRQDIGDARGISSAGSGGNAVGNGLHGYTSDNRSTVGSVAADIRIVRSQGGLQGGRSQ